MSFIKCNDFVKRQTEQSGYSHFDGTWEELEKIVATAMTNPNNIREGYKPGVLLVDVPCYRFYSAIVELNESSKLRANYTPRRIGEAPFIRVSVKADKQLALYASVVLYSKEVLAENNEATTDADYEIVCIKARVSPEEEPMDPYTMARNYLHLEGGTKGEFTAQQFAESIVYWNNHCMAQEMSWFKRFMRFLGQGFLQLWYNIPYHERL